MTASGDQTLNNPIRRKWFALALGGLCVVFSALLPSPAHAQCRQWDVSGQWKIKQGSFLIFVDLNQNGKTVSGTARQAAIEPRSASLSKPNGSFGSDAVDGSVSGTVDGDRFDVQINWSGGGAGVYRGTLDKNGYIRGTTYDRDKPGSTASWHGGQYFKCADAEPATPKPIGRSGKARPAATQSADAGAAADAWINQELNKRRKATQPTSAEENKNVNGHDFSPILHGQTTPIPSAKPRGFINGLQLATPTPRRARTGPTRSPRAQADESASDDPQGQQLRKHHPRQNDDPNQGND